MKRKNIIGIIIPVMVLAVIAVAILASHAILPKEEEDKQTKENVMQQELPASNPVADIGDIDKNTVMVTIADDTEPVSTTETTGDDEDVAEAVEDILEAQTVENMSEPYEYAGLAIAICDSYVNVRSIPSTEGKILGKIYRNCAAEIIEEEDGWYKMTSGSLTGYIKAEYFVTGKEAEELAISMNKKIGKVTASALRIRKEQSTDSEILYMISGGSKCVVISEEAEWAKVEFKGVTGWVSKEYLDISIELNTAITLEEEAAKKAEEAKRTEKTVTQKTEQTVSAALPADTANELRSKIVAYALQFVGNKYVYGGNSLTTGTDCSGFTMLVYKEFGYSLSRRASTQYSEGSKIDWRNAQPGDLIFYGDNSVDHVVIYIGNGKVVHASTPETGIKVSDLNYNRIFGAIQVIK